MALSRKVLWIVNMDTLAIENQFGQHARAAGINTLCIRTSTNRLPESIAALSSQGFDVYAWRWPSANAHAAMAEASKVATLLIPAGLKGYIVDPESDSPGASNDWNRAGLANLAQSFCATIKDAAPAGFRFGTTSGCIYPASTGKPQIPWSEFFAASDALFPQTYWRWTASSGRRQNINGGTPAKATARGMGAWTSPAQGKAIIPMAGEIDVVTPAEIADYGRELNSRAITEGHFYADSPRVSPAVLAAISAL
ncbi:hypothetical protein [Mesorhizobium sp. WSM3224]|uniref:hypothetical protein n=1 Tax=Mesorhizobium sp. WSM3224 TaxID=1040986 RepID=UPI000480D9DA|nr:hypothetical protein [Mesorhizobium sp. WSM3224]